VVDLTHAARSERGDDPVVCDLGSGREQRHSRW
jgi:hypothetical protein